jgi:hypothetical protein
MISNFVPLVRGARDDLGVLDDIFADHKKRGFDVMGCEKIEQFWRELCAGPIVKGHGDIRSIDMH